MLTANSHHTVLVGTDISPKKDYLCEYFLMAQEPLVKNREKAQTFVTGAMQEVLSLTICSLWLQRLVGGGLLVCI